MHKFALVAASWGFIACGGEMAGGQPPAGGDAAPGDTSPPSGLVLLTQDRLASMKAKVTANSAEWQALKKNVDTYYKQAQLGSTSVENAALVGLLTGDRGYCDAAAAEATRVMSVNNPAGDSYLGYPDAMMPVATTLSWCATKLTTDQRKAYATYLDKWTNELWYNNQGSGWGLHDPGNNYHMAFLQGTAFAAYALKGEGHANAQKYIDLITSDLDSSVVPYLDSRAVGGGWLEGTNYGEVAKLRLGDALSVILAGGGKNYFTGSKFFGDEILFGVYQVQPANHFLFPAGDMARTSNMQVNPYERAYIQMSVAAIGDSDARAVGQWYVANVVPTFMDGDFVWREALYRDLVYKVDGAPKAESDLPFVYWSKGTGWVAVRTGWDAHATNLTIMGTSVLDQSHGHFDTSSFTIWRDGWQAADAVTYSKSGLLWDPGAHNMLAVAGAENRGAQTPGLKHFADDGAYSYAQIDATGIYVHRDTKSDASPLATEVTRDLVFLKPSTVVLYDRFATVAAGTQVTWRLHTPEKPTVTGMSATATHEGGGVAVVMVVGDAPQAVQDTDLESTAWRIQATSGSGRFLAAVAVGSGGAPALTATHIQATGDVDGLAVGGDVVVFSRLARGAPAAAFSYTVPTVSGRVHTLVDLSGSYDVQFSASGGTTTVTVKPSGSKTASADGVLRVTE